MELVFIRLYAKKMTKQIIVRTVGAPMISYYIVRTTVIYRSLHAKPVFRVWSGT